MTTFKINGREIGPNHPSLVIAEIGINHGGSIEIAKTMAKAAISAGAEIIKHQTHIVEDEMSDEAKHIIPKNADNSIFNIMKQCALSEEEEYELKDFIEKLGCIFISTPFSRRAVERLEKFNVPAYKIGSGECNNYPLVELIASKGKPVILSTGMNSIKTIEPAVNIFRSFKIPFALLHCTNVYPTPHKLVRLGAMNTLKEAFPDAIVGLSDHTVNNNTCIGAIALGASIVERHFTDTMERIGPDIACSMDTEALRNLIQAAEELFLARGEKKEPVEAEKSTMAFAFASVVAAENIKKGMLLNENNIWIRRPGGGDFGPRDYKNLFGKVAKNEILNGCQIKSSDIEN